MRLFITLTFLIVSTLCFSQKSNTIYKIRLLEYPKKPFNKSNWDKFNARYKPDIYMKIKRPSGVIYSTYKRRVENVSQSDLPISWFPQVQYSNSLKSGDKWIELEIGCEISFYDYDSFNDDDFIGTIDIPILNIGTYYYTEENTNRLGGYGRLVIEITVIEG